MTLDLYVDDESIESPFLTRAFMDEIIFESYISLKDFLDKQEQKIVYPNPDGEITLGQKKAFEQGDKDTLLSKLSEATLGKGNLAEIGNMLDSYLDKSEKVEDRERDSQLLFATLKKVQEYLIDHRDTLPLVHIVYETEAHEERVSAIMIDGVEAIFEGDLHYYDDYHVIRNKLSVKSYMDDHGKVDFLIDVQPVIEVNGTRYFTQSITKSEQFQPDFKKCFDFLEKAIKMGKRVLWEYS
ncbi:MAG: hypothetical protein AB8F95_09660 [Bacteroidia bacterium]